MKKILIFIVLVFFLFGCNSIIYNKEVTQAQEACKNFGGLNAIMVSPGFICEYNKGDVAYCCDGRSIRNFYKEK